MIGHSTAARVASICSSSLLREKILVVPSLAVGHQIADAVAHGGTPWVNLRTETIRTLADAVASFDLTREGLTVLSRAQALAIVECVCDEVLDDGSYFAALKDRPGLHRAIQKSLDDLRHAGVDLSSMPESAFEHPRKRADLARLLAAYERELIEGRFVDRFRVLARAIELLESGAAKPWAPDAIWMSVDDLDLTHAEERLLSLASGENLVRLESDEHGTPAVDFRRAVGEENELRGAFRTILAGPMPFDDAEIVYTTREPYLALAIELTAEHDIPCTFAEGIPAPYTRPGQAVLGFLRWIGEGWDAIHVQRIARTGVMRIDGSLGSRAFARVLRNAAIGWGRDRYLPRLDALIAGKQVALDEADDPAVRERFAAALEQAKAARAVVTDVLGLTDDIATGDELDPADAARAAAAFVRRFAAIASEIDGMASAALQRMFEELSVLSGRPAPRALATARLAEAVAQLHVAASNPRPGHLHVAPVRAGGWSARKRMFIAGADDSKHPGRGLQDPVVLDSERTTINERIDPRRIALLGEAPRRTTEQFQRLISRSGSRAITISFSQLDLEERREHFPAPVFLDLYRRGSGNADASYDDIDAAIDRAGFVDRRPISRSEWWLMRRFSDGHRDFRETVLAAYPALAAGAEAERERASERLTKWDGRIDAPPEELDPRRNGRVYSASQLETMASCPYKYFLARILRVEPLDELKFEPDRWLEPLEFGSLLHEVLEKAMNELCAAGEKPSMNFRNRMEAIADEALARWRAEIPPPNEAAFDRRRTELVRSVEIFLRNEEDACRHVTPKFFEVSFGMEQESDDTIAMPDPLTLKLDKKTAIRLRGRIDRIDCDEKRNEWSVWDYKSGGTWAFDGGGRLQKGTKIQHAIYARAVEAMVARKGLKGRVVRSGYFFPTPKGRGARIARVTPAGDLEHALNALFDVVGRGYFPHASAESCRWCDFAEVCGGAKEAAERSASKIAANGDDPAVAAWLRLQEIE